MIGRANLDRSGFDPDFIHTGQPEVISVDAEHIYWTDPIHSEIGRANLDGTDPDPSFIDRLLGMPHGLAVDAGHIYWTDSLEGAAGRANLDGTGIDPSFIESGPPGPATGVAVDPLLNESATRITCAPAALMLPGAVSCTAAVTDAAAVGAVVPLGIVHFSSSGAGAFTPARGCSLIAIAGARSACQLTYTPLAPGEQTITADYAGDADRHIPSSGDATLEALAQPAPSHGDAMPEAKPQSSFTLAGPKLNRRRGTATLTATVPGSGRLLLAGNGLKRVRRSSAGPGRVKLVVRPNRKTRRMLTRRGSARVVAKVTFTPSGGDPNTRSKRLTLRLRERPSPVTRRLR